MSASRILPKMGDGDEKGKRTGVMIQPTAVRLNAEGMEDLDDFFGAAVAPDKEDSQKKSSALNVKGKKSIRFSLDTTAAASDGAASDGATLPETAGVRKLIANGGRGSMSPSEISRVSTAPPSGEKSIELARHGKQTDDTDGVLLGSPLRFSPPIAGDDDDDDEPFATQDDDDDDMVPPPPPPDSPEPEEQEEPAASEPVEFPMADDDDDDEEGAGYDMARAESPEASEKASQKSKKSKKRKANDSDAENAPPAKSRKKETKKRKKAPVTSSEDEDETAVTPAPRRKKGKDKPPIFTPKGIQAGPREFSRIQVSDLKETPEAGLRRSKRMHIKPLEFWKGESIEYGPNEEFDSDKYDSLRNMPVPKAIRRAENTPYKPRKVAPHIAKQKTNSKKAIKAAKEELDIEVPFDSSKLPKNYIYTTKEDIYQWEEINERCENMRVVAYLENLEGRDLPVAKTRRKSEGKVSGLAAQAFHTDNQGNLIYPNYIMGNLLLPPSGIKDAESVGMCAQCFTVVTCQPKALEVAFSNPDHDDGRLIPEVAVRVLLKQGDMFRIPPGNSYRLQNHSTELDALLSWVIVRQNEIEE